MSLTSSVMTSLCRGNKGILTQKLGLLNILASQYNNKAQDRFQTICPIVGASIGQHFRHSMDHMELAILVAHRAVLEQNNNIPKDQRSIGELHYDLRVRGGTLEKDFDEAKKRIISVMSVLDEVLHEVLDEKEKNSNNGDPNNFVGKESVNAYFMLGGDPTKDGEVKLTTTVQRELGFVAHHAMHHMAMVKIIAMHTLGIKEHELPIDFGRAPSTVQFDQTSK